MPFLNFEGINGYTGRVTVRHKVTLLIGTWKVLLSKRAYLSVIGMPFPRFCATSRPFKMSYDILVGSAFLTPRRNLAPRCNDLQN